MRFNTHNDLEGTHAMFSPSQSAWLRYDDEKIIEYHMNKRASEIGTIYHAWAKQTIDLRIKQPKTKKTLYAYVNDAIGFQMNTEVVLKYSNKFFGTADAISFRKRFLRIHDLKTGKHPARMEQLEIYAALFCLEYGENPEDIKMELRIYQNDEVVVHVPEPEDIRVIMNRIIYIDRMLDNYDKEE